MFQTRLDLRADGQRAAEPNDDVQPAAAQHARQPAHGRRRHPAERAHDATASPAAAGGCRAKISVD